MDHLLNTASLLRSTREELQKIELTSLVEDGHSVLCAVETRFLEEEVGESEQEHRMLVYWDAEMHAFTIEIAVATDIPPSGYGWALDQLNSWTAEERWMLQARIECPEHDEEPQLLALIGSWKFPVPGQFLDGTAGRPFIGSMLCLMLQTVCMDTILTAIDLTDDYANLQMH